MHVVAQEYLRNLIDIPKMMMRWQAQETSNLPAVFVVGPPRSGTTLLNRILLNHTKLFGFPLQTNLFSPRSIYSYKRFSHYVSEDIYQKALDESKSLVGFFDKLHRLSFPDLPDDGWFVEKTPQHARHVNYILPRMPKAKVVFVVRDGRDTFCSGRSGQNIPQSNDLKKHAQYYNDCVAPLNTLTEHSDRVHVIRYEDFTAAPEEGLEQIMSFLGLEAEPDRQLAPSNTTDDERAGRKPFERLSKAITPATVGRWRKELNASEIAQYNAIARESLKILGYPIS